MSRTSRATTSSGSANGGKRSAPIVASRWKRSVSVSAILPDRRRISRHVQVPGGDDGVDLGQQGLIRRRHDRPTSLAKLTRAPNRRPAPGPAGGGGHARPPNGQPRPATGPAIPAPRSSGPGPPPGPREARAPPRNRRRWSGPPDRSDCAASNRPRPGTRPNTATTGAADPPFGRGRSPLHQPCRRLGVRPAQHRHPVGPCQHRPPGREPVRPRRQGSPPGPGRPPPAPGRSRPRPRRPAPPDGPGAPPAARPGGGLADDVEMDPARRRSPTRAATGPPAGPNGPCATRASVHANPNAGRGPAGPPTSADIGFASISSVAAPLRQLAPRPPPPPRTARRRPTPPTTHSTPPAAGRRHRPGGSHPAPPPQRRR